jgi:glycosyltransferase A (GT-A) superfamily protein (DUF2064 family)
VNRGKGAAIRIALAASTGNVVIVQDADLEYDPADWPQLLEPLVDGRADAVFGPAEDGGYWLGGFGPRRPPRAFAAVRWSTEHALADTLANCRGRRVALLRRLRDVDTAADLEQNRIRFGRSLRV